MNVFATELPNSKAKLQERLQAGRITWTWPLIVVFARLIFAVLAQALVAGLFIFTRPPGALASCRSLVASVWYFDRPRLFSFVGLAGTSGRYSSF
jgi:hypothetical protein